MAVIYKFGWLVVLCMVVVAPYAEALSCGEVVTKLMPCLGYLRSGAALTANCCSGVKAVNGEANTSPLRKIACGCLKQAFRSFPGIDQTKAETLPSKCGVSIPYKISPATDCSKVN